MKNYLITAGRASQPPPENVNEMVFSIIINLEVWDECDEWSALLE
jgi:hypothetical protein